MPAKSGAPEKTQVSPGVIALFATLLILVVGWMGYHYFGPPPHPVLPDTVDSPAANFIRQKAHESRGDISKLSPEDQQRLQSLTQGKGAAYLKRYANVSDHAPTQ